MTDYDRVAPQFYVICHPEGMEAVRLDLTDRVLTFEYEDDEKKADLLKLTVNNWNLANFDDPVWKTGNKLIVSWGYPGRMAPPRECIIQKVTGSVTLAIEAQSKACLMNKDMKNDVYENVRRSELVHAIAKSWDFADEARDIEETFEVFPTIVQARSSDAQFLKKLADLEGFEFYIDFDGLHWHKRRMKQKPLRVLHWYTPPDVGDIVSFDVTNDVFAKPGKVTMKSRDPLEKKDITASASNGETAHDTLSPGEDAVVDPAIATFQKNTSSEDVRPTTETSPAQVKREADGVFRRAKQNTVEISVEMVGDPYVVAKSVVELRGISKRLSGLYYVKSANHKISGAYTLSLKTMTDGTHGHSESLIAEDLKTPAKPAVPSKADQNPHAGEDADPEALAQVAVGTKDGTVTSFVDKNGRQ